MATDLQAVRQAAETEMKFSAEACPPDHPLCKFYEAVRLRHRMLAEYALNSIPADGHLPITAEWLREVWGINKDGLHDSLPCGRISEGVTCWLWVYCNDVLAKFTTRHQFMQLAAALGIQRKRKDGV